MSAALPQASDVDTSTGYTCKESTKQNKLSPDQLAIIQCLKEGWELYQSAQTFQWYMKRIEIAIPFRSVIGTVYKPSCLVLQFQRIIVKCNLFTGRDNKFVLK